MKLVDALASEYAGRSYIIQNEKLFTLVIQILKNEYTDSTVRKSCLGIVQKLSLRRRPQEILIEQDLIRWTTSMLSLEKHSLSEYSFEYGTALLMNLSLRSFGRQRCEEIVVKLLSVLMELLKHVNTQVRSFVSGTLYSVLTRPVIKAQALKMGLEPLLRELMRTSPDELQKNYSYILGQLTSLGSDDENLSDINEDEHDADIVDDEEIGEEDDFNDQIDPDFGPVGEELLARFELGGKEAENVE